MKVEIPGAREVMEKMKFAITSKAKKGIRKGSRAGAKIVQAKAKQLAPKKSGKAQKQIKVRALDRSRKWTGATCRLAVAGTPAFYISFVDLGAKHIVGRRFMRDAAEETKAAAGKTFVDEILAELK